MMNVEPFESASDDQDDAVLAAWREFFATLSDDAYFPPYFPACSRSWIGA